MILFQFLVIYLHLLLALRASRRGALGIASRGTREDPKLRRARETRLE